MDYYSEFSIRSDTDINIQYIMTAIYNKLHRKLAKRGLGDIGVSFPDASITQGYAGQKLRVHSSKSALEQIFSDGWAEIFRDYAHVSDIRPIPSQVVFRSIFRVQPKMKNLDRMRRRAMKRHGLTMIEAKLRIPDALEKQIDLPHVWLQSSSSGERFCLFFNFGPIDLARPGRFSAYGLSREATVPWF